MRTDLLIVITKIWNISNFLKQDVWSISIKDAGLLTNLRYSSYKITEPPNTSYNSIEHEAKRSTHQREKPLKIALNAI